MEATSPSKGQAMVDAVILEETPRPAYLDLKVGKPLYGLCTGNNSFMIHKQKMTISASNKIELHYNNEFGVPECAWCAGNHTDVVVNNEGERGRVI